MRDAEASRYRTCLVLDNKKQNMFTSENNLESTKFLESTRRKGSGIHPINNRQKSEFLLISIILKNVYRLKDLFKDFLKLDRQENIF